MEEYSEMNGQNDEQNTGGEFGGSYYQHNAMPREKKSGQNSCAGYILVGILCLLVGIAVGSCTTTLAISGIKEAAESVLPGEDKGSGTTMTAASALSGILERKSRKTIGPPRMKNMRSLKRNSIPDAKCRCWTGRSPSFQIQ